MTINCFGDSITNGNAGTTTRYPVIVGQMLNTTINNYGVGGTQIADQMSSIYNNTKQDSTLLTGVNDLLFYGSSTYDYEKTLLSALVYLGSSSTTKGVNCGGSSSWVISGAYGGTTTICSSVVGDVLYGAATGTVVYVALLQTNNGGGGLAEISIDGTVMGTYSCYGNTAPKSGLGYSPTLIRFNGLSNTSHTITIKNVSTGANKTIFVDYIASNCVGNKVVVSGVVPATAAVYASCPAPINNGSVALCATYSTLIQNTVITLQNDGLNIKYIPLADFNASTMNAANDVHPNTNGQYYLASVFYKKYLE